MFKKNVIATAFILSSLYASVAATAQTYVGATIGKTSWTEHCVTSGYTCLNSTAYKLLGGYEISRHWGIEASYYDMGTLKSNYYYDPAEFTSNGIDLAAVVRFQFGESNLSGFVKTGFTYDHGQEKQRYFKRSNILIRPMIGLGLNYKFTDTLSGRFDIDARYTNSSSYNDNWSTAVSSINFGVVTTF